MDLEKEVSLLKYHVTLLSAMADTGKHPFFSLLIMYRISEHQSNTLIRLLTVLYTRKIGTITKISEDSYLKESRKKEKISFDQYGIAQDELYKFDQPTYKQFAGYSNQIMGDDVSPYLLLEALRDQCIHAELCEYLLEDAKKQT